MTKETSTGFGREHLVGSKRDAVYFVADSENVKLIALFGLGAPGLPPSNRLNTVQAMKAALFTGERADSPMAAAVYNTSHLSRKEAENIDAANFFDQPFVRDLVTNLEKVEADNAVLTVESYSGGLFFSMLAAALANPDTDMAGRFLDVLKSGKISKVVAINPAIVVGNYTDSGLDKLDKFAYGESNLIDTVLVWSYLWNQSRKLANARHFLFQPVWKIHDGLVSRARQLRVCSNVLKQSLETGFSTAELLGIEIEVVEHANDPLAPPGANKEYYNQLRDQGLNIRVKTICTPACDPHNLYASQNDPAVHEELSESVWG